MTKYEQAKQKATRLNNEWDLQLLASMNPNKLTQAEINLIDNILTI